MKQQEASLSRDLLPSEIKGWNKESFERIREHAVRDTGLYTESEFDDLTDWRILKLLDIAAKVSKAPKQLSGLKVKGGNKPPVKGQATKPVVNKMRDRKGRFIEAKGELQANPGDKNVRRDFFLKKLQAERDR